MKALDLHYLLSVKSLLKVSVLQRCHHTLHRTEEFVTKLSERIEDEVVSSIINAKVLKHLYETYYRSILATYKKVCVNFGIQTAFRYGFR